MPSLSAIRSRSSSDGDTMPSKILFISVYDLFVIRTMSSMVKFLSFAMAYKYLQNAILIFFILSICCRLRVLYVQERLFIKIKPFQERANIYLSDDEP